MSQLACVRFHFLVVGPTLRSNAVNGFPNQGGTLRRQVELVFPGASVALHHLLSFDSARNRSNVRPRSLRRGLSPYKAQGVSRSGRTTDKKRHCQLLGHAGCAPRHWLGAWPMVYDKVQLCGNRPQVYYSIERHTVQHLGARGNRTIGSSRCERFSQTSTCLVEPKPPRIPSGRTETVQGASVAHKLMS